MTDRQSLMVEELIENCLLGMDEEEEKFVTNIAFEDRELDDEQEVMLKEIYERYIGYGYTGQNKRNI